MAKEKNTLVPDPTPPLPWHQKSRGLLLFLVFLMIVGIGVLVGLAFTGLLLTFFIAAPIIFFVGAILMAIKIAYDNRPSLSSKVKEEVKQPVREQPNAVSPTLTTPASAHTPTTPAPHLPPRAVSPEQEKLKPQPINPQDNVENQKNTDLSKNNNQENIVKDKIKKIILQFEDSKKEISVPLDALDKIANDNCQAFRSFITEFIFPHIPKCYAPFLDRLNVYDVNEKNIYKGEEITTVLQNEVAVTIKLKLGFSFSIKKILSYGSLDLRFEIPVKQNASADEINPDKVGVFFLRETFNRLKIMPQKLTFFLNKSEIGLNKLIFCNWAEEIFMDRPSPQTLGPHALDKQWCIDTIPYEMAPPKNEYSGTGFQNFTILQQEIFKASKIPPEKQKIFVIFDKEKIELTEKNFSSISEKNINNIQVFLAPPKKTKIYWSTSPPSDRMQLTVFESFDEAIRSLEEGSNPEVYAIEVDQTSTLCVTPIANKPTCYFLTNKAKEINQECLLFSHPIGMATLMQSRIRFESMYWFNAYDSFVQQDKIYELLADYNFKKWLKENSIVLFNSVEEGVMSFNSKHQYLLPYLSLLSQLEKNELNTLAKDLFSLTKSELLDKYLKSKNIAFIIKLYYMILPGNENSSSESYRASLRYLIQNYNDLIQKNDVVRFDKQDVSEEIVKSSLCVRYFNFKNREVFSEDGSHLEGASHSHLEGVDLKTGACFYETMGKRPGQEDAMVFNRLSVTALSIYRKLSLAQKKQLMIRACKKAQEKYGQVSDQGSCAVFTLLFGKEIIATSLGDSVIFLVIRNADKSIARIQLLSDNHGVKYISDEEVERIRQSLGSQYARGERMGVRRMGINMARAFGDLEEKGVSSEPVIKEALSHSYEIPQGGDALVLLGCDGLWEGWPDYDKEINYINYVEKFILFLTQIFEQENIKTAALCDIPRLLASSAIVYFNSGDNVSIMLKRIDEPLLGEANVKSSSPEEQALDFLGVLDGHGGSKVSSEIAKHIVEIIEEELSLMLKPIEDTTSASTAFSSPLLSSSTSAPTPTSASVLPVKAEEQQVDTSHTPKNS